MNNLKPYLGWHQKLSPTTFAAQTTNDVRRSLDANRSVWEYSSELTSKTSPSVYVITRSISAGSSHRPNALIYTKSCLYLFKLLKRMCCWRGQRISVLMNDEWYLWIKQWIFLRWKMFNNSHSHQNKNSCSYDLSTAFQLFLS